MKLKKILCIFCALIFMFFFSEYCGAYVNNDKKLIILLVDSITLDDIINSDEPNLQYILKNGYLGLMNARSSGYSTREKSYVTLGAGRRAESVRGSANGFNIWEKLDNQLVKDIYFTRMGNSVEKGEIVNININLLKEINKKGDYGAIPGSLGEILNKNGIKIAVIGNGDVFDEKHREITSVFMDINGIVEKGIVDKSLLIKDNHYPTGYRMDYEKILNHIHKWKSHFHVIAVQITDLYRLEKTKEYLNSKQYIKYNRNVLKELDDFLGKIKSMYADEEYALMLIIPFPSAEANERGEKLTPVVLYMDDSFHGVLTSPTTRRDGIITNTDFLPWVLSFFGIHERFSGNIIPVKKHNHIKFITDLSERTAKIHRYRSPIIKNYIVLQIFVVFILILGMLFYKKRPGILASALIQLCIFIMCVPISILILPIMGYYSLYNTIGLLLITTLIVVSIINILNKGLLQDIYLSISFLCIATAFILIIDLFTGANLIKNSLLGYCPIIGARFYGIGNEYCGILIGSTIVGMTILKHKIKIPVLIEVLIFLTVVATIALPFWGANFGGTITAVSGFFYALIKGNKNKFTFVDAVKLFMGLIAFIFLIGYIDYFILKGYTHFGRLIGKLFNKDVSVISDIIFRKISMNIRLLQWTIWSQVLLTFLVFLVFIAFKPLGILSCIFKANPFMEIAFASVLLADVVGMLVNDSGVVISATISIYMIMTLCILILEKKNFEGYKS